MTDAVLIATSNVADGSMSVGASDTKRLQNRRGFLETNGITAEQTILVHLLYDTDDFRRYTVVGTDMAGDGITAPSTIVADALFSQSKDVALLLPIADCIGAVLYDQTHEAVGLAHLGRHNLLQQGGTEVCNFMQATFASEASTLRVFLSAAAGSNSYPLFDFDNKSLHQVAIEQLMAAGVKRENIQLDERDTTTDDLLFSHSQFLKGERSSDGRQAIVCMLRPSGA